MSCCPVSLVLAWLFNPEVEVAGVQTEPKRSTTKRHDSARDFRIMLFPFRETENEATYITTLSQKRENDQSHYAPVLEDRL